MAYKAILAYLANASRAKATTAAAAAVARRGDAHVTGLYVVPAMRIIAGMTYGGGEIVAQMLHEHRIWHDAESANVRNIFDNAMAGEAFASVWHRADTSRTDPLDIILEFGRTVELIVAAHGGEDEGDPADERVAERLMMGSGRPILFVPGKTIVTEIGHDVTVGWNGSRESARAVFDALPLLRHADIVRLVCIDPRVEAGESVSRAGDIIAAGLSRCGVTCEAVEASSHNHSVGEELLSRAADHGSDLVVMGGYGHSSFRELVFGGVTQYVLRQLPVPVLMSH